MEATVSMEFYIMNIYLGDWRFLFLWEDLKFDTAFQNSSPEGQKNLKYLKLKKILINKHIFQINKIFYN